jgi:hypothetical protein
MPLLMVITSRCVLVSLQMNHSTAAVLSEPRTEVQAAAPATSREAALLALWLHPFNTDRISLTGFVSSSRPKTAMFHGTSETALTACQPGVMP